MDKKFQELIQEERRSRNMVEGCEIELALIVSQDVPATTIFSVQAKRDAAIAKCIAAVALVDAAIERLCEVSHGKI